MGHLDNGQVILLQGGLPGETVSYRILHEKKKFLMAEVLDIVDTHPKRREPPCPYYKRCGGCDLQHCEYEEQLFIKDAIIKDLLIRQGIELNNVSFRPCHPSPLELKYRQRIRLQIEEHGVPGFLRFRSHDIIPIHACLIAEPAINGVLEELKNLPSFFQLTTHCRELELLFNPVTAKVICLFHMVRKPRPADIKAAKKLVTEIVELERCFFKGETFPLSEPLGDTVAIKQGKTLQCVLPLPVDFPGPLGLGWEVGGFCQVNLAQNTRLVELVLKACQPIETDSILDLYCGMGNFSIPLAKCAASVLGVEGQGSAIRSAKRNSSLASLDNTLFIKSPIHACCEKLFKEKRVFDCVVIDPPRQGVLGLAPILSALTHKRLVYISCDPATLCRDLSELIQQGFVLKTLHPVDMFPQTHHIETLALLEKN